MSLKDYSNGGLYIDSSLRNFRWSGFFQHPQPVPDSEGRGVIWVSGKGQTLDRIDGVLMTQVDMKLLLDSCVFIDCFDPQSPNHPAAADLLRELRVRNLRITMPAHGWFEVQCAFQKLKLEHFPIKSGHFDGA
ncbi:MAG: hypothetical protein IIB38_15545, partial [Candidatus Hydrogenedentes bacterium]|nr:hypothetical protein [Candidatus Hydrogenedentota bacterium]